jgi:hypothetical protein
MVTSLIWLLLLGRAVAQTAPALVSLVEVGQYFASVYAERPVGGTEYTYFVGEPIEIKTTIVNRGGETHAVRWPLPGASGAALVQSASRDGVAITLPLEVHPLGLRTQAGDVVPQDETATAFLLAPGERLERNVLVRQSLGPGAYEVELQVQATDDAGRRAFQQVSRLTFEVRAAAGYGPEIVRREGLRRLEAGDFTGAQEAAARLRAFNPSSHAATSIEADVAARTGRHADAARLGDRAVEEARSGADALLVKFVGPAGLDDYAKGLAAYLRRR